MGDKVCAPVPEEEMLKPASLREMEFAKYKGHHTVCQKLREAYALATTDEQKLLLREAMAYAKAMHRRLKAYKQTFDAHPEWTAPQ